VGALSAFIASSAELASCELSARAAFISVVYGFELWKLRPELASVRCSAPLPYPRKPLPRDVWSVLAVRGLSGRRAAI
jgi:hypothetical protein